MGAVWVEVVPGDSCLGEGVVPSYREAVVSSLEVGADLQSQTHMITFQIKNPTLHQFVSFRVEMSFFKVFSNKVHQDRLKGNQF